MKKIVIIVLMFTLSACAIVVHVSMPTIRFLAYMYILLLSTQPVDDNGKYKKEVLTYYEEDKNIILPKESIDVKYYDYVDPKYIIDFKIKNKLKTKYILEEDDEINSQDIPKDLHLRGLREYIIDNLLYDKSKGNHFDKIEEYLQKNRERIFKIFLDSNEKGVRIYFDVNIMYKLPNRNLYLYDGKIKINNHIEESLGEYGNENYVENKEKGFFKEKVKYEDIDWGKYIEYMEVYPVLYMNVIYKDDKDNIFDTEIRNNSRNSEKLLEIYKEMEKFYNKKTFNFVIENYKRRDINEK